MMKAKHLLLSLSILFTAAFVSCKKDDTKKTDPVAPAQVTDVSVKNFAGGSTISYKIASTENLTLVKAVCELSAGKTVEATATPDKTEITFNKFTEYKEYTVKIYSVGEGGLQSEPVTAKIKPEEPTAAAPAQVEDVVVTNTYDGAVVKYSIPNKDNLDVVRFEYVVGGETKKIEAGINQTEVTITGITERKEYELKIFSVGLNATISEPVTVKFFPKEPVMPAKVTNAVATVVPYGAEITFENANKDNLASYKVVYMDASDAEKTITVASDKTKFTITGLTAIKEYTVKIYSVAQVGGLESAAVEVKFTPIKSPAQTDELLASLTITAIAGGVNVAFDNPDEAQFTVILTKEVEGVMVEYKTKENVTDANVSEDFLGMYPTSTKVGVTVIDKWGYSSEEKTATVTPQLLVVPVPSTFFANAAFDSDNCEANPSYPFTNMWDNAFNQQQGFFISKAGQAFPQWFTLDMGCEVILTELRMMQRFDYCYRPGNVEKAEIWGSLEASDEGTDQGAGTFGPNWVKLADFQSTLADGTTEAYFGIAMTQEDKDYAHIDGEKMTFTYDQPVRYLRFKTLKTFGTQDGQVSIHELKMFGHIVEYNNR